MIYYQGILQSQTIILLLILSAVAALGLAMYGWRYRYRPGGMPFTAVMVAMFLWTAGFCLEIIHSSLPDKIFWANVQFIGIAFLPVLWLALVADYTDRPYWKRIAAITAVLPVLTNLVIWTDAYHHLFRGRPTIHISAGTFPVLVNDYGPWFFWVHALSGGVIFLLCLWMLVKALISAAPPYRRQVAVLLVALVVPLATDTLYIAGISPVENFNFTPVMFSFSGLLIGWSLFRYQFLNLMPAARSQVVAVMTDGVVVLDSAGRLIDVNAAAQTILPEFSPHAVGHPITEVLANKPDLLPVFLADQETQTEFSVPKDAESLYYHLHLWPMRSRRGLLTGRFAIIRDITHRRNMEADLRTANAALEEKNTQLTGRNDELRSFAHTVAHDLKNPLSTLLGYIQILASDTGDLPPEILTQVLEAVQNSGARMGSIIDSLLLLSEARQKDVPLSPLDVRALAVHVLGQLAAQVRNYSAEVILVGEAWPQAVGYGPWVESLWTNYITNGLKYGGRPPRLELGAVREETPAGPMVRFWVQDNGDGLSAAEQERLFTPFTRLESGEQAAGHGLGLSIVLRIAQRLNGQAGVVSSGVSGEGSTFYFTLPCPAGETASAHPH